MSDNVLQITVIALLVIIAVDYMTEHMFRRIEKRLSELEKFKRVTTDKWLQDRPHRSVVINGESGPTPELIMSPESREYIIGLNVKFGMSREAAEKLFEMNYGNRPAVPHTTMDESMARGVAREG